MSRAGQGLQPLQWLAAPALLALVVTVLFGVPVRAFGLALPEPVAPMVPAFAWAVIRPSILPPLLLLLCGLFLDLFWGGALGLWPTALLLCYSLTFAVRPLIAGTTSGGLLGWYVTAVLFAFTAAYLAAMLDSRIAPSLWATGFQFAFTVALYPLARFMIDRFEDADIRFR